MNGLIATTTDNGGGVAAGYLIGWCIAITVGYYIGSKKNRPVAGAVLGGLLGIIGWIIAACLKAKAATSGVPRTTPLVPNTYQAGWYQYGLSGQMRYHDGFEWTEHVTG